MRHRYPFEALHWLRQQRVDRQATALGVSAARAAAARAEAARAEAVRISAEQALSALSAAELSRLEEGGVRVADLGALGDWQKGATIELAAKAEREQRARQAQAAEAAQEAEARRALATASNEAQLIDAHRTGFRTQRAKAEELAEEEAAVEQWTAAHFTARRR